MPAPARPGPRRRRGAIAAGVVGACAIGLALVFAFLRHTPLALEGVAVSPVASCKPMVPAAPPATAWSGSTLDVRVEVFVNCAAGPTDFRVQRLGRLLLVRAATADPVVAAGCLCSRGYTLQAGGLPVQDYRVVPYAWP